MSIKKARISPRPFYMSGGTTDPRCYGSISLSLDWRETTSDSIIAELLHARIHTTRKAEASE